MRHVLMSKVHRNLTSYLIFFIVATNKTVSLRWTDSELYMCVNSFLNFCMAEWENGFGCCHWIFSATLISMRFFLLIPCKFQIIQHPPTAVWATFFFFFHLLLDYLFKFSMKAFSPANVKMDLFCFQFNNKNTNKYIIFMHFMLNALSICLRRKKWIKKKKKQHTLLGETSTRI